MQNEKCITCVWSELLQQFKDQDSPYTHKQNVRTVNKFKNRLGCKCNYNYSGNIGAWNPKMFFNYKIPPTGETT